MKATPTKSVKLALLTVLLPLGIAACSGPSLDNPRAKSLLAMPGPIYYAEKDVAKDLANRCKSYSYNTEVANALNEARATGGAQPAVTQREAIQLETGIKQRSLAAYYGEVNFAAVDACTIADGEVARQSPLSLLLRK